MKRLVLLSVIFFFALPAVATNDEPRAEPTRHLTLDDINSMEDAKKILIEKTAEIKGKQKLDPAELQQIHIITYSVEKSVAFFAEHLTGEQQELAEEIAVVVEDIHIASENNRQEETKKHLSKYFALTEVFISDL